MTRILILGANGQLARNTTRVLLRDTNAKLTLYLRQAHRLTNPNRERVMIVEGDVLDPKALTAAMKGQHVVYANLSGDMKQQAECIVNAMHATGLRRLVFISSMGIYGEAPGERYRSVLDPYRDSAAAIEASDLDYTLLRPGWFTHDDEVSYQLTQKGEPFKGHDVSLNSLSDFIVKLALTAGLHVRQSLGISRGVRRSCRKQSGRTSSVTWSPSVDGRIVTERWKLPSAVHAEYERTAATFKADAWIIGRVSMEPYAGKARVPTRKPSKPIGRTDFIARREAASYAIAVDPSGKLRWQSSSVDGEHVITVLTEQVTDAYLAFLPVEGRLVHLRRSEGRESRAGPRETSQLVRNRATPPRGRRKDQRGVPRREPHRRAQRTGDPHRRWGHRRAVALRLAVGEGSRTSPEADLRQEARGKPALAAVPGEELSRSIENGVLASG